MTDNGIIKALECCHSKGNCDECPLNMQRFELEVDCVEIITQSALDLINRQKAEIEGLEEILGSTSKVLTATCAGVRAKAIKEFAELLKRRMGFCDLPNGIVRSHIDNLVKEMTEGQT